MPVLVLVPALVLRTWWRQVAGAGVGRFLLQITMSCLRALSRQVAGAGGRWKQGAGAGRRCRGGDTVPVLGAGSAHGRDSGRRRRCCELAVCAVETGRRCWALAARVVETGCRALVLGALVLGAVSWCAGTRRWRPLLTVK